MEWIILEAQFIFVINLFLWGIILICPTVAIKVENLRLLKFRPQGLAFLNLVFIRRDHFSEHVLRHELEHVRQHRLFSPLGLALFILVHYSYLYYKYRSFSLVYKHSVLEKWANEKMYSTDPLPRGLQYFNK